MSFVVIILLIVLAFLPATLSFQKKIHHKSLFAWAIIIETIKPLSTIAIPFAFNPSMLDGVMYNYIALSFLYYIVIFAFYYILIRLVPASYNIYPHFLKGRTRIGWVFIALSAIFFIVLVVSSGGVFLLDPRKGYQYHREGVGFVWAFYILSVGAAYYFFVIKQPINTTKVVVFTILMFFTGSKQLILEVFIKSFLVYIWSGIKIKKWQIALGSIVLVILMLKLFDQFGSGENFLNRVDRYFEFMNLASLVFEDYEAGLLDFQNGNITLTSLWSYVPRMLYPEKPYAYGTTYLVEIYFPGLAATGRTPSFGMLTHEFVDFGWLAPLAAVLLNLTLLLKIFSLVILCTNAKLSRRWTIAALAFVLIPGFGFHLPVVFIAIFAFIILPSFFVKRASSGKFHVIQTYDSCK
ncbi:MAG: hypothetical protein RPU64_03925 [Candidatus Sedimenticola sp. (ex Thyasira tokunagai)]